MTISSVLDEDITRLQVELQGLLSQREQQVDELTRRSLFNGELNELTNILVEAEVLRHTKAILETGDLQCHLLNQVNT